jgi:hypothetical protein
MRTTRGKAIESAAAAREASRELARLLGTADGARTARALQRAGALRLPEPALPLPPGRGRQAGQPSPPAVHLDSEPSPPRGPEQASPPVPGVEPPAGPRDEPRAGDAGAPKTARRPRPISIWQPRGEGSDLAFVRPAPVALGDHFAARREIRPKRAPLPLRVCLFGESAAAGYLYAPHLTPAGVLDAQLRAVAGEDAVEVIDLARTNETLASLLATVESAVQIQPDVLVVFAGNNWNLLETPEVSPYAPSVAARQSYAEAWRAAGPTGPVALAAERLREAVDAASERIALIARAIGVPVVVVVPEVSLAGWESRQPVPWLPFGGGLGGGEDPGPGGDGSGGFGGGKGHWRRGQRSQQWPGSPVARWYRLLAGGRRHLDRGAWGAAARAAQAMLDLDGGTNPTSWRLLARARMGTGDEGAAAAAARSEIDAAAYPTLAFLGAPQAGSLAQELLRRAARRHGFACVDLPEVFATHTGSPLSGRRLFLDYCHLTAEGIEVAMAAVACEVLRLSGVAPGAAGAASGAGAASAVVAGGAATASTLSAVASSAAELGWRELLRRLPRLQVAPEVEAVARLGAAVHGAHRLLAVGAKAPFLEAWCDAALDASPGIESAMLDLVDARAAPLPAVLTAAQRRNHASGFRLGLAHGWRWDYADAEVTAAILASLERHGRPAARAEAEALLIGRRGLRAGGTDLLDPPWYLWEPLERFYPEVMSFDDLTRPATLRCPWPETSLCLICDGTRDVGLEITARLPLPPSPTPGEPGRLAGVFRRPIDSQLALESQEPPVDREASAKQHTGSLLVSINGNRAAIQQLGGTWRLTGVRLPRHLLKHGWNRITLHWPRQLAHGDEAQAAALARLDEGIAADLHPVFGELYSVVARSR